MAYKRKSFIAFCVIMVMLQLYALMYTSLPELFYGKMIWLGMGKENKTDFIVVSNKTCTPYKMSQWDYIGENKNWSLVVINHFPEERRILDIIRLYKFAELILISDADRSSTCLRYLPKEWEFLEERESSTTIRLYKGGAPTSKKIFDAARFMLKKIQDSSAEQEVKVIANNPRVNYTNECFRKAKGLSSWNETICPSLITKNCSILPHVSLLQVGLNVSMGPIVELGISACSTHIIHKVSVDSKRFVHTADSNETNIKHFNSLQNELHVLSLVSVSQHNNPKRSSSKDRVFISMSVCHSLKTNLYHKRKYPYREAALLSSRLWLEMTYQREIAVHIFVIHVKNDKGVHEYVRVLEELGVYATTVEAAAGQCVLLSQMYRMFAYRLPFITDNDTIVTSDVDAFPRSAEILHPLSYKTPVNVFQHGHSVRKGIMFAISFISMYKTTWRETIACNLSILECIKEVKISFNWGTDQSFITKKLLAKRICFINNRRMYSALQVPFQLFNDSLTCGHFDVCNNTENPSGAFWQHFYPHQTFSYLLNTYYKLIKEICQKSKYGEFSNCFPNHLNKIGYVM